MSQSSEIVKSGYLTKSPPEVAALVSQWRRRWFVLLDSSRAYPLAERSLRMEYYQSESDTRRLADPKGVVNLKGCSKIVNREPVKGHKFVFDVHTMNRVFHLAADTAIEKHEWVQTLNNLLFTEQDSKLHPQAELAVDLLSRRVDALDVTSQQKAKPKLVRPYFSVGNNVLSKPEKHIARPVSFAPGDFFNRNNAPGAAMSPTSSLQLDLSGQPLSHRPLPGVPGQARKYWPLPPPPDHQPRPASVAVVVMTPDHPDHEEIPRFEQNYEMATSPDDDPRPTSPGPYEVARPLNYEDIDSSITGDSCKRDGDIDCNPQPYEEYNGQYESIENNSDDEAGQTYEQYDSNHDQENGPLQYEVPALTLAAQPPPPPPSSKRTQPLPPLPYGSEHSSISPPPPPVKKPIDSIPASPPKPLPRKKRNIVKTSSAPPSTSTDNLHGSLPNILESSCEEDALWSTVTSSVGPTIEIETGDYGHISMPRRFSQPECDIKPLRPKPRSPPQLQAPVRMKKRYENVGVLFTADPSAGSLPDKPPTPPMRVENLHQDYSRLRFLN